MHVSSFLPLQGVVFYALLATSLVACGGRLFDVRDDDDASASASPPKCDEPCCPTFVCADAGDAASALDATLITDATLPPPRDAAVPDAPSATSDAATDAWSPWPDASPGSDAGDNTCDGGCAGGTCFQGRCIVTLADNQGHPFDVVSDGVDVYWTNIGTADVGSGSVMRAPVDGGLPVAIATARNGPRYIAADRGQVFFGDSDGAWTWAKATSTLAPIAPGQGSVVGIAVDEANVYWGTQGPDYKLRRAPRGGGPPIDLASGQPDQIVLSPTTAYWFNFAGATVFSIPLTGGTPTDFCSDPNVDLVRITVDANNLYYTEQGSADKLTVVPLDGGAPTAIAADDQPFDVVSDGAYVYFTLPSRVGRGAVMRASLDGGAPTVIATGNWPEAIAIDATSVYWTSSQANAVMKATPR